MKGSKKTFLYSAKEFPRFREEHIRSYKLQTGMIGHFEWWCMVYEIYLRAIFDIFIINMSCNKYYDNLSPLYTCWSIFRVVVYKFSSRKIHEDFLPPTEGSRNIQEGDTKGSIGTFRTLTDTLAECTVCIRDYLSEACVPIAERMGIEQYLVMYGIMIQYYK